MFQNIFADIKRRVQNNVLSRVEAGIPTNGASGSGATFMGPGSNYIDLNTGYPYINVGTQAAPQWGGQTFYSKATYDFSVDGGATALITPALNQQIPINAIILGGVINIITTLTSGGSATISIGTSAGSSASSIKAATAVASYSAGFLAMVPLYTAASYVKLSAAGSITITVATAALTAGKMDIILLWVPATA